MTLERGATKTEMIGASLGAGRVLVALGHELRQVLEGERNQLGSRADGQKEHHQTLRLCQDCAEICSATARVTSRDGPLSGEIVAAGYREDAQPLLWYASGYRRLASAGTADA